MTALNSSVENYMERMAENNSKALIEALKEVIRDFNAKINEQFGDNFQQLNSAVERILVWQEAYRQQMAEMIDQQQTTTENMSIAALRYSELVQQAERFATIAAGTRGIAHRLGRPKRAFAQGINPSGESAEGGWRRGTSARREDNRAYAPDRGQR